MLQESVNEQELFPCYHKYRARLRHALSDAHRGGRPQRLHPCAAVGQEPWPTHIFPSPGLGRAACFSGHTDIATAALKSPCLRSTKHRKNNLCLYEQGLYVRGYVNDRIKVFLRHTSKKLFCFIY